MNKKWYAPYSLCVFVILSNFTVISVNGDTDFKKNNSVLSFVDPNKDPQYYIDRYYNEGKYQAWFDKNYPNHTIEEAVGYHDLEKKSSINQNTMIPEAQAITNTNHTKTNNGEAAQIILSVAALAILFGATYGVKKKIDDNSRQISINRDKIKQKIIKPIMGHGPLEILQIRLAKGEITLKEYNDIKNELKS